MIFLAEGSVGFLDIPFRSRFVDIQELVVVFGANDQRNET